MPLLIGILLVASLGGSVSYAAENAAPGDTLYPVKVSVNEEVRGLIAISDQAKARWEAQLAERRLEEAAKLAAENRLSADVRANLEARAEAHAARAEERSLALEEEDRVSDAAEVRSRLEAALRSHAELFENIATDATISTEVKSEVAEIRQKIEARIDAVAENRTRIELRISEGIDHITKEAAAGARRAATNVLGSAKAAFDRNKDTLSARAEVEVTTWIADAEAKIAEGDREFEAASFGEAFVSFQTALRLAVQVQTVIHSLVRIEISIEDNADAEDANRHGRDNEEGDDDSENRSRTDSDSDRIQIESESNTRIETNVNVRPNISNIRIEL